MNVHLSVKFYRFKKYSLKNLSSDLSLLISYKMDSILPINSDSLSHLTTFLDGYDTYHLMQVSRSLVEIYTNGDFSEKNIIHRHWTLRFPGSPPPRMFKQMTTYLHCFYWYDIIRDTYSIPYTDYVPQFGIIKSKDMSGLKKLVQVSELLDESFDLHSMNASTIYENGHVIDFKYIHTGGVPVLWTTCHHEFIYFCKGVYDPLHIVTQFEDSMDTITDCFKTVIVLNFPDIKHYICSCCGSVLENHVDPDSAEEDV